MNITPLVMEVAGVDSTKVTATSRLTGRTHTVMLPVAKARIERWLQGGTLIQDAFPDLDVDQREFLLSGATPEEWGEAFKEEE